MQVKSIITNPKTLVTAGLLGIAATIMTPIDEFAKLKFAQSKKEDLQEQYDKSSVLDKIRLTEKLDKADENLKKAELDYNNFYNVRELQINSAIDTYTKQIENFGKK